MGVISHSIDQVGAGIPASQATGNLPPSAAVTVLKDDTGVVFDSRPALAQLTSAVVSAPNRFSFPSGTAN